MAVFVPRDRQAIPVRQLLYLPSQPSLELSQHSQHSRLSSWIRRVYSASRTRELDGEDDGLAIARLGESKIIECALQALADRVRPCRRHDRGCLPA